MSKDFFTSSRIYAVFCPVAIGLFVFLGLTGSVISMKEADWSSSLFFLILAALMGWALRATWGRFVVVTVNESGILVAQNGFERFYEWCEVRSFWTIPFVSPAIHRFTFSTSDEAVYFVPKFSVSLNLCFWTFHFSGLARFIKQHMKVTVKPTSISFDRVP
jgi:hypothetical protein